MNLLAVIVLAATFTRPMERVNSIDPLTAQSVYDSSVVQLLYRTPLEIDYRARPYRLVPGVCELPDISADGLTYVFRMVPNLEPQVTAEDVVRSLVRIRDPQNASPGGWTMKAVKSLRVRADGAVEIRLKERSHIFPWMMAMSYAAVQRADGSGTGPYILTQWRKNHDMIFTRREPKPGYFDTVRYLVVNDVSTQWLMFLKGEVDFLAEVSRDNWDAIVGADGQLVPELAQTGMTLHSVPSMDVLYIGFNMNDPVLGANQKLRQALSCAFDFPTWQKFYNYRIDPADGPLPKSIAGRLETPSPYTFDLARAKQLLAEAGYPGGIDPQTGRRLVLTLSIGRANQESRESGELLASFFAKIGIKLELSFSTWGAFLQAVNEGRTQMYMMGWVGDYPDAENFLQLFYSKNQSPGPNHSNYSNPAFDAAFEAAMASATPEERNVYWRQCQEIVREDCPWIYTHYPKTYTLTRPTVQGYVPGNFPYGQEQYFQTGETK